MIDRTRLQLMAGATLRIVAGAMFACHGIQKVFGFHTPPHTELPPQLMVGGVIELACGVLVALGLLTRPAALLASGTMAVAYFQFHWKLAFTDWKFLPLVNGGELAVLYCFVFLVFGLAGSGAYSVDNALRRRS